MNVSNAPQPLQAPEPGVTLANSSASSNGEVADSPIIAIHRDIFVTHLEIKTPDGQSYLEGGARKLVLDEATGVVVSASRGGDDDDHDRDHDRH